MEAWRSYVKVKYEFFYRLLIVASTSKSEDLEFRFSEEHGKYTEGNPHAYKYLKYTGYPKIIATNF